jgi:hypothetical protein
VVHLLYVDGSSEYDSSSGSVLGYAYHGSSIVLFKQTIADADPGFPMFAPIENVVLAHELGHLLGLVDNGIPMVDDHADPEHAAHDSNADCLMYWAVDTSGVVDMLMNGAPDFDAACRADVAAAGGNE